MEVLFQRTRNSSYLTPPKIRCFFYRNSSADGSILLNQRWWFPITVLLRDITNPSFIENHMGVFFTAAQNTLLRELGGEGTYRIHLLMFLYHPICQSKSEISTTYQNPLCLTINRTNQSNQNQLFFFLIRNTKLQSNC